MKIKANQVKPTRPNISKVVFGSVAILLAALALQGCAAPKTAWLREIPQSQEAAMVLDEGMLIKESRPLVPLLTFSF